MPEGDKPAENLPPQAAQPGAVITPGDTKAAPVADDPAPQTATPTPVPVPQPAEPEPAPTWTTSGLDQAETSQPAAGSVSWTASEFIAHDKSSGWYLGLAIAAVVGAILIFLITKDAVSVAVIVVAAIVFGVYGARRPRQIQYRVDQRSLTIGDKRHGYDEFKSFTVMPEGAFSSIIFMPLKRFSTVTTIYYAPEDEEKILKILTGSLPYEEPRRDAVESLMRRIKF
jgi:uncharacterized membrane protein